MSTSPIAPTPTAGPAPYDRARVPVGKPDVGTVEQAHAEEESPIDAWMHEELTTVVGTMHSLVSAPGVVASGLKEAADNNRDTAHTLGELRRAWSSTPPAAREPMIREVDHAMGKTPQGAHLVERLQTLNNPAAGAPAKTLPHDVAQTLRKTAGELRHVANEQAAAARTPLGRVSGVVATPLEAVVPERSAIGKLIAAVPGARAIPLLGIGITTYGTFDDIANKHIDPTTAIAANGVSLVASAAAGEAVTALVATAVGGAAVGGAAVAGAVVAAPVEAVVAGVAAAVVTGYVVYKAIESDPAQHIIGGIVHGDKNSADKGFEKIGAGASALAATAGDWAKGLATAAADVTY